VLPNKALHPTAYSRAIWSLGAAFRVKSSLGRTCAASGGG